MSQTRVRLHLTRTLAEAVVVIFASGTPIWSLRHPTLREGATLLVAAILLGEVLINCGVLLNAFATVVAAIVLVVVTSEVNAEGTNAAVDSGEVVASSDELGPLLQASDVASTRDDYLSPRFAFDENLNLRPKPYPVFAQKPDSTTGDSGLPTIPTPSNSPAPPPANVPPPATEATDGAKQPADPTSQFEKDLKKNEEEAKKKAGEKPIIPDLAKGLLIATNDGDLTFKPGLRIQPRFIHDSGDGNNDFFIRRFRLKGSGSAYGVAKYGVELREDNEERTFATPNARVENAWLDFKTASDSIFLRAGVYDLPFSRDALTSDSKILFMDRSLIMAQLTLVGMADNTDGLMLHGRPDGGRYEYAFGIFDSSRFERFGFEGVRDSDHLMPAGRFVWSLLDPSTPPDGYADYQASYLGKGQRFEIGTNAAQLSHAIDGPIEMDIAAWGVDCFANSGCYTFQAEYDQIIQNIANAPDNVSDGWYAQFGYMFDRRAEFAVRYETLDPLIGDNLSWTRVGFNFYIREHNLKIQTDYCFRSGNNLAEPLPFGLGAFDEDVIEVQLQLDF